MCETVVLCVCVQAFEDLIVRDSEFVAVELVAMDKKGTYESTVFQGSVKYEALKRTYDNRVSGGRGGCWACCYDPPELHRTTQMFTLPSLDYYTPELHRTTQMFTLTTSYHSNVHTNYIVPLKCSR